MAVDERPLLERTRHRSPYSSTRRSLIHCARRTLRNPRTGPGTRCESGQKGHTKRVPCAFAIFSTITAQPALHNRNCTWGGGASFDTIFATGLAARRGVAFRARVARRGDRRDVRVAVMSSLSIPRRAGFIFSCSAFLLLASATACAAVRSSGCSYASCASWHPELEIPREFAGDCLSRGLPRHRADDPPDSWPRRAPLA